MLASSSVKVMMIFRSPEPLRQYFFSDAIGLIVASTSPRIRPMIVSVDPL